MKILLSFSVLVCALISISCTEPYKPYGMPIQPPPNVPKPTPQVPPETPKEPEAPKPPDHFATWKNLIGNYRLAMLDDEIIAPSFWHEIYLEETPSYIDPKSNQLISMLMFPLYSEIKDGLAYRLIFGVMDGLGTHRFDQIAGQNVYRYLYNGPVKTTSNETQFNVMIQLTVVEDRGKLEVHYVFEMGSETLEHSYTLIREP
ncbi:hypothetical protein D3C87_259890 [compost metagenome]